MSLTEITLDTPVGQLAASRAETVRILEKHGIDYCCHGEKTLAAACDDVGVNAKQLLDELGTEPPPDAGSEPDWSEESLTNLCDHIEQTHHWFLREQLPYLAELLDKVVVVHQSNHPELQDLRGVFLELRAELEPHMKKEERILFPALRSLEQAGRPPTFPFGSVRNPIGAMEDEHEFAGRALRRLRELTSGYTPAADACNSFRALYAGLEQLEADLHLHIHKENNILFPRAAELESAGTATTE